MHSQSPKLQICQKLKFTWHLVLKTLYKNIQKPADCISCPDINLTLHIYQQSPPRSWESIHVHESSFWKRKKPLAAAHKGLLSVITESDSDECVNIFINSELLLIIVTVFREIWLSKQNWSFKSGQRHKSRLLKMRGTCPPSLLEIIPLSWIVLPLQTRACKNTPTHSIFKWSANFSLTSSLMAAVVLLAAFLWHEWLLIHGQHSSTQTCLCPLHPLCRNCREGCWTPISGMA